MADVFQNLAEIPFRIYLAGREFCGTITPTGHVLPDGIPSAFIVRLPEKAVLTISKQNGVWRMPGPEEFALELGIWIELYYA